MCLSTDHKIKEDVIEASSSSHCFSNLQPESMYRISIHSRLGTIEGAAVTILHSTGQLPRVCVTLQLNIVNIPSL